MSAHIATCVLLGAVFLGAVVQGFSGFAFSAVAGAVLLQFEPPGSAIPLLMLCSLVIQVFVLVRLRKSMSWWESLPYIVGGIAGMFVAMALFTAVEPSSLRVGFGSFLVIYASWTLLRPRAALVGAEASALGNTAIGFAGGLVGGFTAMPGAVLAIWCDARAVPKALQRGLIQPFIASMQMLGLMVLLLRAEAGAHQLLLQELVLALPALLLGTTIGLHLFGKVNDIAFRRLVCILLLFSGVAMVR